MENVDDSVLKHLYFGNLPTDVVVEEIENYVRNICDIHGSVRSLAVIQFGAGKNKRKKRDKGNLHCGYGYMQLQLQNCQHNFAETLKQSMEGSPPSWQSSTSITIEEPKKPPDISVNKDEELKKKEEKEMARQLSREHKKRRRVRNKQIQTDKIKEILEKLNLPPSDVASLYTSLHEQFRSPIDWASLHPACDPERGGGLSTKDGKPTLRSKRKRSQAEAFAAFLQRLVKENNHNKMKVVDFGCGSGNLTLALAALFPDIEFVGLDMKQKSIDILCAKVSESGLSNLEGRVGMIETFDEDFSVGLSLHACGNATDFALMKAREVSASFVVSPCCVGKLKFSLTGGSSYSHQWTDFTKGQPCYTQRRTFGGSEKPSPKSVSNSVSLYSRESEGLEPDMILEHPRSIWMRNLLTKDDFRLLAQAADCHEDSGQIEKTSKTLVELDRSRCMDEGGYSTALIRLTTEITYPKNDAIVGVYGDRKITHILSLS